MDSFELNKIIGAILGTFAWGRDKENEQRFDTFLLRLHTGADPG